MGPVDTALIFVVPEPTEICQITVYTGIYL